MEKKGIEVWYNRLQKITSFSTVNVQGILITLVGTKVQENNAVGHGGTLGTEGQIRNASDTLIQEVKGTKRNTVNEKAKKGTVTYDTYTVKGMSSKGRNLF